MAGMRALLPETRAQSRSRCPDARTSDHYALGGGVKGRKRAHFSLKCAQRRGREAGTRALSPEMRAEYGQTGNPLTASPEAAVGSDSRATGQQRRRAGR